MTLRRNADGAEAPASPPRSPAVRDRTASLPPGEQGSIERATAAASLLHDTLGALWGMAAALRAAGRPVPPTAGVRATRCCSNHGYTYHGRTCHGYTCHGYTCHGQTCHGCCTYYGCTEHGCTY
jgi:hypothetical protein